MVDRLRLVDLPSRRDFLETAGVVVGGALLAACTKQETSSTITPEVIRRSYKEYHGPDSSYSFGYRTSKDGESKFK
jgi:uncharacterized lipoprotein YajG